MGKTMKVPVPWRSSVGGPQGWGLQPFAGRSPEFRVQGAIHTRHLHTSLSHLTSHILGAPH